jgi:outer membrane lipoprotein carrier protein
MSELKRMVLKDKLGQTVRLEFFKSERNPPVAESEVKFTPPSGADVIGTPTP